MAKGNFIKYVVSDNPDKYPNDGEQGNYYYVAIEDVTPEVTAQTPIIAEIANDLGITITTPSGSNKQILQGNNTNLQSINQNITPKDAETIAPGTSNQVIPNGTYLRCELTIAGDSDLVPENIKENVDIFGVVGTAITGGCSVVRGRMYVASRRTSVSFRYPFGFKGLVRKFQIL